MLFTVHVSYDNFRVDASEPEEKPAIVEGKYIDRFVVSPK